MIGPKKKNHIFFYCFLELFSFHLMTYELWVFFHILSIYILGKSRFVFTLTICNSHHSHITLVFTFYGNKSDIELFINLMSLGVKAVDVDTRCWNCCLNFICRHWCSSKQVLCCYMKIVLLENLALQNMLIFFIIDNLGQSVRFFFYTWCCLVLKPTSYTNIKW